MKLQPNKPRVPFCWDCSRQLHGRRSHDVVVVAGVERLVHKSCGDALVSKGEAVRPESKESAP